MKKWLFIGICALLLIVLAIWGGLHLKSHQSQPIEQSLATIRLTVAPHSSSLSAESAPILSLSTVPEAPLPPTPVVVDPNANHIIPQAVVPVHIIMRQNALHPGIAYDVYSDTDRPLNLRVTLNNPFRMPKAFDCHLEPGKGSYCEIGFNQGFSGSRGDTLTIEAADYLPLIFTP